MVNVHIIFREGNFVDCSSVSFGFTIPDGQECLEGMDIEDLYRPVYSLASDTEFEDD
jgi:hypothetical protein